MEKSHNILIGVIEWATTKANSLPVDSVSGIAQINLLVELMNVIDNEDAKSDNR